MIESEKIHDQGRCIHYHTPLDVVCYRFPGDNTYYPCHLCYEEAHQHPPKEKYPINSDETAVLCGVCETEIPINVYTNVKACPHCGHPFNPRCKNHFPLYFEI